MFLSGMILTGFEVCGQLGERRQAFAAGAMPVALSILHSLFSAKVEKAIEKRNGDGAK
jgi:hypothetical protein